MARQFLEKVSNIECYQDRFIRFMRMDRQTDGRSELFKYAHRTFAKAPEMLHTNLKHGQHFHTPSFGIFMQQKSLTPFPSSLALSASHFSSPLLQRKQRFSREF
jgi:hypothetical protein